MAQQIIALILIVFFLLRLLKQKKDRSIGPTEFYLWLTFWLLAGVAIVLIKQIDNLVAYLGFSGSGINVLLYLSVLALFYLIFRLRLSLAKLDRDLSELNRHISLSKVKPANKNAEAINKNTEQEASEKSD